MKTKVVVWAMVVGMLAAGLAARALTIDCSVTGKKVQKGTDGTLLNSKGPHKLPLPSAA